MLVIHPKDRTTAVLAPLYAECPDARMLDCTLSGAEISRTIRHTPRAERIMLLGHGCDKGLLWREDDTKPEFDRTLVGHPQAAQLRHHGGNIVAVFCHADQYARAEGLHGLFTGMIISELHEAYFYDIPTTQEELDREIPLFVSRLRALLDDPEVLLSDIPALMARYADPETEPSPLCAFNYARVHYL